MSHSRLRPTSRPVMGVASLYFITCTPADIGRAAASRCRWGSQHANCNLTASSVPSSQVCGVQSVHIQTNRLLDHCKSMTWAMTAHGYVFKWANEMLGAAHGDALKQHSPSKACWSSRHLALSKLALCLARLRRFLCPRCTLVSVSSPP